MRLFGTGYIYDLKPFGDGVKPETIRIAGRDLDDFGREAFLAGFRYARENPTLVLKGEQE